MNDKVRNAITTEFTRALTGDVPTVKYQARKILTQSPLLKKFGLDKKIHGPISRLIIKEIGDKMYDNIQTFRQPRTTTLGLLKYLEDVVDPKYKSAISEARKAADYATRNKWKDAKKAEQAAEALCITASKLLEFKLIDIIIPEPLGGAHRDYSAMSSSLKMNIINLLDDVSNKKIKDLIAERKEKLGSYGDYQD